MSDELPNHETGTKPSTKLARLLASRRVSQVWLAKAAGYGNTSVISELCAGKQRMSLFRAIRIAGALGVPVAEVMEEPPPDDPRCPACGRTLPSHLRQRPLESAANY